MSRNKIVTVGLGILLTTAFLYDWYDSTPLWIYIVLVVCYLIIHTVGSVVLSLRLFLPVKFNGKEESKAVAITFDDGPIPFKTEKILEILYQSQALATFFCIGHRVADHPEVARRIHDAGHLIGNHSYWHGKTFDLQSSGKIKKELFDTDEVIEKSIGFTPLFFRPPYGVTNPMVARAVKQSGHETIGWSVRSFDTITPDPEKLMKRITKSLKGGDIILLHDYCDVTIEILPKLIHHIASLGLKMVRVDELLSEKAYREDVSLPSNTVGIKN